MSAPEHRDSPGMAGEDREYALLIATHANRELTTDERRRLLDLAEQTPERQAEIAAMEKLHDHFAAERSLRKTVSGPLDLGEAGDESYRRLATKAAEAEVQLRARLLHRPSQLAALTKVPRRWPLAAAAMLIAALCFWFLPGGGGQSGLLANDPGDNVLGMKARIVLSAELSRSRPVFSWSRAVGASRYDAFIEDRDGVVLMRRSSALAGLNRWNVSDLEFDSLEREVQAHQDRGGLFLRIVGQDGAGISVASSGSLSIALVK